MSEDKNEPIRLGRPELSPQDTESYRKKINMAKSGLTNSLKGSTPLGGIQRQTGTPLLVPQKTQQPVSALNETGGVQPRPPGSPLLSAETAHQLQQLNEAQKKQTEEQQVAESAPKADIEETKDFFELMDFNRLSENERILNNKIRRKEIEDRCSQIRLEDLVLQDEVKQFVPIVPGKFFVEFRSTTPTESLFVKRLMADEKVTADQYLMEKYSLYQVTCSLVSINGVDLPSHRDEHGEPNEDLFMRKLKMILRKSLPIIADIGLNFYWFDLRVRRLLNPEDLKNG